MFELHQLENFLAVVECGTVSRAAEKLNITQPALSRSLQNLEYELKTPLFNRTKNKVILTPTGEHAASLARKLLSDSDQLISSVREFHRVHSKLIIASCAPCDLLFKIRDLAKDYYSGIECEGLVKEEEEIVDNLLDGSASMGIFSREQNNPDLIEIPLKTEELYAMIPENHPLAKKDGIYFSEINGEPVLPFPLKGHWNNLLEEKLPDSQLLYQTSVETFDKVVHASNLISFESNFLDFPVANHVKVPILDEEAKITYHFGVLKANREQYRNFIRLLEKNKGVTQ